ncbi:TPA: hypothetical protein JC740_000578 [Salmonella enterica subsp. diarizonae]|nr:hypothetical protein [Salmonella enterica subsp. diarizonae]
MTGWKAGATNPIAMWQAYSRSATGIREKTLYQASTTQELADAKAENDALQRRLDAGGRVHVKGRCSVPAQNTSAIPGSVGDAATIELSPVAGRNVLGIRAGIINDQGALRYLQDYIRTQCR